jgi:hypothetical protein
MSAERPDTLAVVSQFVSNNRVAVSVGLACAATLLLALLCLGPLRRLLGKSVVHPQLNPSAQQQGSSPPPGGIIRASANAKDSYRRGNQQQKQQAQRGADVVAPGGQHQQNTMFTLVLQQVGSGGKP